jgi:protein-S-isoprenylcysteine O-methyltransferase Ste14
MNEQTIFHLIFVIAFSGFTLIRMYYHRLAARLGGKAEYKEGKINRALRAGFGFPYILMLFAYMLNPRLLDWAAFVVPSWVQWVGAGLSLVVLPLIIWIQHSLGLNFSTTLHVREEHTLVTAGPYRWVRHPMYTVFFVQAAGFLMLTHNLFIGGVYLVALTLVVISRVCNEEAAMIEKFGEAYRSYMKNTGRFGPRIRA